MPESGWKVIDDKYQVNEESLLDYDPKNFYPVRIGEVFNSRYQVIGKLGWGESSTVWLCRDLVAHRYVTLKVYSTLQRQSLLEEKALEHIAKFRDCGDVNENFVRSMLDKFDISCGEKSHHCLVQEPMALTLKQFADLSDSIDPGVTKLLMQDVIRGVYFLHETANVIHTDIQPSNIMMSLDKDDPVLKQYEEEQFSKPSQRKWEGDRVIYACKAIPVPDKVGNFVLCDLGEAQFNGTTDDEFFTGDVMPTLYRAPEICLAIPWSKKIDIWALGMLLWDLVAGKRLFLYPEADRKSSIKHHLGRMIALLGPPPKEFLQQSPQKIKEEFFDDDDNFKHPDLIPDISLEFELTVLEGKERTKFLVYIRRFLQWQPELRATLQELFDDPWLNDTDDDAVEKDSSK